MWPKRSPEQKRKVYQLKISLLYIEPPIWRRVLVSGEATLLHLHRVIQIAMGWTNSHLHQFIVKDKHYSIPSPDDLLPVEDERNYKVSQIAPKKGSKFIYEYDFGDGWQHEIVVERVSSVDAGLKCPVCLAGERACPPEDVGGPWGYQDFVEAMKNPKHKEHRHYKEWWGGKFDPEAFDLLETNVWLQQIDSIIWWDEEEERDWWEVTVEEEDEEEE